uniref:Aminotransferase class I/classII large domain-containing protein n=1 Tax=Kalanchoe fedtschenkoi TaxID=63787 RepID=A0A7N0TJ38_KALFE
MAVNGRLKQWAFQSEEEEAEGGNKSSAKARQPLTVRTVRFMLMANIDESDKRLTIPLAHGDPSAFPCFQTARAAEDAVVDAVRSAKFNGYSSSTGLLQARRAVAGHLSPDLPYELSPEDVYLTVGCTQAIEITLRTLQALRPGANILLPRPGYPYYEVCAGFIKLGVKHYNLVPERGWEVDLNMVESLADDNTMAIVLINPCNPCGNVFTSQHLKKVAELARKLGIMVIADEVYGHLVFGSNPFVPIGKFGSIAPVITLGSLSKRWIVPGWRLGWIVTSDPNGIFEETGIVKCLKKQFDIASDPATFTQGALPQILEKTNEEFFSKTNDLLRELSNLCYDRIQEIPCITCPHKPEGSMFVMAKLDVSLLDDIVDDMDFCLKLAKEESVIALPGVALGFKNWLRISFAISPSTLEDGLGRVKMFCQRHLKKP